MVSRPQRRATTWRANIRIKKQKQVEVALINKKKRSIATLKAWERKKYERGQIAAERLKKGREKKRARLLTAQQVRDLRIPREQSRNAAMMRSHRTQKVTSIRPSTGRRNHMPSSWIKSFAYDSLNQMLYMTVKAGQTYEWDHISPLIASLCMTGDARCTTDDTMRRKRWWVGKWRSLGGAYWKYLSFSRRH